MECGTQESDKFIHLVVMHITIVTPVMTLIGSERKNQQFGFERRYLSDAVGMGESKTSGAVHSFIYIGNSTEGFGQPHIGGLRIDMPANMAVANMYDTHRIFGAVPHVLDGVVRAQVSAGQYCR